MENRYGNVFGTIVKMIPKVLFLCFSFIIVGQIDTAGQVSPIQATASLLDKSTNNNAYLVSVHFENEPLPAVLHELARKVNVGISYDTQTVPPKLITYQGENKSIYAVLKTALEGTGLYVTLSENRKVILIKEKTLQQLPKVQEKITGTVTDAQSGETLPGVNIMVKGTTTGTSTDGNGAFELTVESLQDTLIFSFIGYQAQEVPINGQTKLDIALQLQAIAGEELVVVGYGTQKEEILTGSVSNIEASDITEVPVVNTSNLLAGKLPGLVAIQRSGKPGANGTDLSIRGFQDPLVVVDGIVDRDFSQLDPSEIESISILKDASAAAVYGVSGGNGVILVTTKEGNIGKPEFSYTANYGVQHITRYPDFVNSAEYAILKNEASINLGGDIIYTPDEIEKFRQGTNPNYPNFDYYDYFVRDYPPQMNQKITVRGGSKNIKYFFLFGQSRQEAMWDCKGSVENCQYFGRYNFRSNIDANITDNLDLSIKIGARREKRRDLIQSSYLMASWLQYQWPIVKPTLPDGKIAQSNYGLSAYLNSDLTGYIKDYRNSFQGTLSINYNLPFVKGLSAKITASRDMFFRKNKNWQKKYYTFKWNEEAQTSEQTGSRGTNLLQLQDWRSASTHIQPQIQYENSFIDKHNIKALFVYEESEINNTNFWANRIQYVVPIDQIFAGPDANKDNGGGASNNGRQSFIGRLNYDYSGKYLFEYSFRYDGSARFAPEKRWGFFSGLSAGWRLSEEDFIRNNFESIDNLKLRLSWGRLGNDETGAFQYLAGYNYPSYNYIYGNNSVTNGMTSTGIPNPNITWEESQTYNLGVDLSLWDRLVGLKVDVYQRNRNGVLATRSLQLPITFGAALPAENLNSDETKGFEISLDHNNNIGDFSYTISPNISFTKTKLDHIEQRSFMSQYDRWRNGFEDRYQNITWGLKAIGQFQSLEDIKSSPIQDNEQNATLRPGDIKYDDYNEDGVIDDHDIQVIGKGRTPEINYGMGIDLLWRNFNLNMNLQGGTNFSVIQQSFLISPFFNGMNAYAFFMDRWHREDVSDPNSKWIPGKFPSTVNAGAPNNNRFSSFWLKDADYLRLKSLNISYDIESKILKKYGVKSFNVSVSGQNLLTFTKLDYIDPEAPSGRLSYYPQQKTYNIGINIKF